MSNRTAIALVVSLVITGLVACSRPEPAPEPVRAVRTAEVTVGGAGGTQEYAAEVRARTESRLGFRVSGKLTSRAAEVGQRVKAGQTLAQIDPVDLKLQQDAAQAALRAAQSSFDVAGSEFKRYKDLREQGFISALELERRETSLQAARSQLEQAKAQAAVQGNLASYAVLTATASGVVTGVDAETGAVLSAGTPVVRMALDGPRDVVFAVPEDAVAGVRVLQGKPGAISVRAWGSSTLLPATVREVAAAADPVTRTFLVKADIGSAVVQLGQTMTVLIELPRRDGVIKLPLAAVMRQQGQSAVWVLDRATMVVKVQPVAVAGADGNDVVIAGGLNAGMTVVTAGVHTLTAGQKVKLYEADQPSAAPVLPAAAAASR